MSSGDASLFGGQLAEPRLFSSYILIICMLAVGDAPRAVEPRRPDDRVRVRVRVLVRWISMGEQFSYFA